MDLPVDPEILSLYREARFRKAFGASHEEFMSQPVGVTTWLLALEERGFLHA